jgi:uncharacterized coiled-coil DUF342 family protein
MNNILNKIAQMERNAAEIQGVELAKHEVEFSIADDSKQLINKYYGLTDTINSKYSAISKEIRTLTDKIDEAVKLSDEMPKVINKYEQLAKEIGVNVDNIQELKDMKLAIKDVNQYKSLSTKLKAL